MNLFALRSCAWLDSSETMTAENTQQVFYDFPIKIKIIFGAKNAKTPPMPRKKRIWRARGGGLMTPTRNFW
jgi:hypothetical protein